MDAHLDQFNADELDRTDIFDSQLRQLEFQYLLAEKTWKELEQRRDNSIKETKLRREVTFRAEQSMRLDLFDQAEEKREKTFRGHLRCRSEVSEATRATHEQKFQESLDSFSVKHKWYLQAVKDLSTTTRPQRELRVSCIIETISTGFITFIRTKHEEFQATYERLISLFGSYLS